MTRPVHGGVRVGGLRRFHEGLFMGTETDHVQSGMFVLHDILHHSAQRQRAMNSRMGKNNPIVRERRLIIESRMDWIALRARTVCAPCEAASALPLKLLSPLRERPGVGITTLPGTDAFCEVFEQKGSVPFFAFSANSS